MLDIRVPIAILFLVVGALVGSYGAWFHPATPATAGINLDLVWGLVMGFFGFGMGAWSWRSRRHRGELEMRVPEARGETSTRTP